MAEIELLVLARRIETKARLERHVAAWEEERNEREMLGLNSVGFTQCFELGADRLAATLAWSQTLEMT